MAEDFYSPRNQRKREMLRLWNRLDPLTVPIMTLIVLGSFYGFRFLGQSQVYTLIVPYILVSFHLMVLAAIQTKEETQSPATSFFRGLPRNHTATYDAKAFFYLMLALYYEGIVLLAALSKLGGDGITPFYRIPPQAMALPFATVLVVLWYVHHRRGRLFRWVISPMLFASAILVGELAFLGPVLFQKLHSEHPFRPDPILPFWANGAIALLMLVIAAILYWRVRREEPELEPTA